MKRTAIALLAGILLVMPGAALAKVPWSSVESVPASPVAGEPLTIVVRFWDDAGHTQPSTWWPGSTHGASVEFHGAAGRIPVTLARTGDAVFQAEVVLAEGVWGLMAVQDFSGASGPSDVDTSATSLEGG